MFTCDGVLNFLVLVLDNNKKVTGPEITECTESRDKESDNKYTEIPSCEENGESLCLSPILLAAQVVS